MNIYEFLSKYETEEEGQLFILDYLFNNKEFSDGFIKLGKDIKDKNTSFEDILLKSKNDKNFNKEFASELQRSLGQIMKMPR